VFQGGKKMVRSLESLSAKSLFAARKVRPGPKETEGRWSRASRKMRKTIERYVSSYRPNQTQPSIAGLLFEIRRGRDQGGFLLSGETLAAATALENNFPVLVSHRSVQPSTLEQGAVIESHRSVQPSAGNDSEK